jgi:hypothetical protein
VRHFNKLLFAFFLLPFFAAAQSNYKPGYVVTLKGDTLHGFIDYRGWNSNPTAISFKYSASDPKPLIFTISNSSFFSVSGMATYQKFTCSVSMDETNTARLSTRDSSYKIDTVFLKILQKGKNAALYSYTDGLKTRLYISEAPNYIPIELVYRIYKSVNANGATVNENTYLKQLFAIANKYNVLNSDLIRTLQTANYSQSDLLPIVSKINNVSKEEYEKKYADNGKINLYLSAALNISNTSSSSQSAYSAGGGLGHTSYQPAVSIGINVIPSPNTDRVELRAELSLAETQFNALYQLKVSPYSATKASFNQLNLSFSPQVIFNLYNASNFKIYAGAGLEFISFSFSNSYFGTQTGTTNNANFPIEPYSFSKFDSGLLLKAGVKLYKNWEVYFSYLSPVSTTQSPYFSFYNNNLQVGVSYFFGK